MLKNLSYRYERKFLIRDIKIFDIEKSIKFHPAIFSEIFYKRRVNNIYLDTNGMENYRDNIDGNPQRLKIRIRWYNDTFGFIEKPALELKIKRDSLGSKLSFPLNSFVLDKNFSKEFLEKEVFLKSKLPNWLIEKLRGYQPSILNSYLRKYFRSSDKKYRITLDNDLLFFKITGKSNSFKNKRGDKETVIIEIKYNKEDDDWSSNITQHFPFNLTKSSKYISGVDLLK